MPRPDRHNEIEVNLLRSGSLTYLLGGRKLRVEARRLSAFWAAVPHQIIDFEGNEDYFVATLPLGWFLQCRMPDALVQALLRGSVVSETDGTRGAPDLELLAGWARDFDAARGDLKHAALLELEARLLRLASSMPTATARQGSHPRRAMSRTGLSKVELMASLIARNYTRPLSVDDIGRSVGLHPNYAMSLFKKTFGTTLVDYVTKQRVSHAQRLLATSDAKVVDVALDSGFFSISRFNAAFRAECGCSPSAYRRQHQGRAN